LLHIAKIEDDVTGPIPLKQVHTGKNPEIRGKDVLREEARRGKDNGMFWKPSDTSFI